MMKPTGVKRLSNVILLSIIALSLAAISYFRLLDNYELEALDVRFVLRSTMPTTDKVVIVEIGEDAIKKLGRFPFDRSYHAILIKALSEFGAKAVIFDFLFSEPYENDREMEEAMRKAGNVYLAYAFDISQKQKANITTAGGYLARCLENFNILARGIGHVNIIPDNDGKFRRVPLYIKYGNAFYPYLPFLISIDYLGIHEKNVKIMPGKYLLCGSDIKIPLDEKSNMIVNYSGKWADVFKHYSYVDVLQSYFALLAGQKPLLNPSFFKDKICLVGLTAAGTVDIHPSPFETLYPGVGIHAEVFNSMLNKRFVARLSREMNLYILILLSALIALVTFRTKPVKGFLALIASILIFLAVCVSLFTFFGIWIDMFYPVLVLAGIYLSLTLYKYVTEWSKRIVMESELDIARKIQESFLPKTMPSTKGVSIAAVMFTARRVGGDLYDFEEFSPDKLGIMIGDVSGKGVPASLFMAMVTGSFKFFAAPDSLPSDVLARLNFKLVKESSSNLFVTMAYSVFDMKNKIMYYANGGHLPLLYITAGRNTEFLSVDEGAPLGLMDNPYSGKELKFKAGDIFVFYTDGITEAMNPMGEMYESRRLAAVVEKNRALDSGEILSAIDKDVRRFEPVATQHDDMTVIVVKVV